MREQGENPATPPSPPLRGSAYRVGTTSSDAAHGHSVITRSFEAQLDLRPDLILDAPPVSVSTKTEE
eukprot:COSAG01_NODE_54133_length_334_cov_0.821277_1_plen_66_part_01